MSEFKVESAVQFVEGILVCIVWKLRRGEGGLRGKAADVKIRVVGGSSLRIDRRARCRIC